MSSEFSLRADAIGKRYRMVRAPRYRMLRETLTAWRGSSDAAWTWALRDVTLTAKPGDVVGIVGRNGCGKSTLLRIFARVTRPTQGRAEVRGRVGSLLEVGTGFHPELTGGENIYLSGAILGMRRREITRKFDAIVAFSGVGAFLGQPLKHLSSGMQLRLAFSVAAHLEPEVLLIDEVLAVGDLEFQQQCFERMEAVASSGRTVLIVSHQLSQLRRLCSRAIWLDAGRIRGDGPVGEILSAYEQDAMASPVDGTSVAR